MHSRIWASRLYARLETALARSVDVLNRNRETFYPLTASWFEQQVLDGEAVRRCPITSENWVDSQQQRILSRRSSIQLNMALRCLGGLFQTLGKVSARTIRK